jgi:hypothetical protein
MQQQSGKHDDGPHYRGVNKNRLACHKRSATLVHDTNLRTAGLNARRSATAPGRTQIQVRARNADIEAGKTGKVGSVVNKT